MGKFVINFVSEFVEISGNSTVDDVIYTVIGIVAWIAAYRFVGFVFDKLNYYNSRLMSLVHWGVRIALFMMLRDFCEASISFANWIASASLWIYVIAGLVLAFSIAMFCYIKSRLKKQES